MAAGFIVRVMVVARGEMMLTNTQLEAVSVIVTAAGVRRKAEGIVRLG